MQIHDTLFLVLQVFIHFFWLHQETNISYPHTRSEVLYATSKVARLTHTVQLSAFTASDCIAPCSPIITHLLGSRLCMHYV